MKTRYFTPILNRLYSGILELSKSKKQENFVFRGPNTFYFARKKYPLDRLVSIMAEHRTCHPGGGGSWNGDTGNGEAWKNLPDRVWMHCREIKRGQWCGPWKRIRISDI